MSSERYRPDMATTAERQTGPKLERRGATLPHRPTAQTRGMCLCVRVSALTAAQGGAQGAAGGADGRRTDSPSDVALRSRGPRKGRGGHLHTDTTQTRSEADNGRPHHPPPAAAAGRPSSHWWQSQPPSSPTTQPTNTQNVSHRPEMQIQRTRGKGITHPVMGTVCLRL
jgi:hypothetical protein